MGALGDTFGDFRRQLQLNWAELKPVQKGAIVAVCAVVFGALVYLIVRGSRPDYVPLYTNLQEADAAEVVSALREAGINYRLAADGTAILVPQRQVYQTRLDLAAKGLPKHGVVGFEIFQQVSFGSTDFERNVKYLWALQGELTRTIREYDAIENARVHISLPEKSLFLREQQPASASILLQLRPGARLTSGQVSGIAHLVAHSVEALDPQDVTIVDTAGNLLSQPSDLQTGVSSLAMQRLEIQRAFERDVERHLQSMLESLYGEGRAIVRVKAEMNFDSEEETLEIFEPAGPEGLVRTSKTSEESSESSSPGNGVAGVSANTPEEAFPTYSTPEAGPDAGHRYQRSSAEMAYEVNRTERRRVVAPGGLLGLSVAVWIDGDLTAMEREQLRGTLIAAIGGHRGRDDVVMVESMPFRSRPDELDTEVVPTESVREAPNMLMWIGAGVLVGLIVAMILTVMLWRRRRVVEVALPEVAATEEEPALPPPMPDGNARRRQEVERLARERPAEFAKLMRTWLSEEE